jgi:hypothetical protein
MGYVLKATCACGYQSEEILQGIGFDYARNGVYFEPAYCDRCGTVEVRDGREESPQCETCYGAMHFYQAEDDAPAIDEILGLPQTDYGKRTWHCPHCKQDTLSFVTTGFWD